MSATEPHRDQPQAPEPEPLSAHQAAELTERIRATLHTGHKLLLAAWRGRAHEALGYAGAEGWARYCSEEFAQARMLRIDAETRREIVAEMRAGGMSTRAIASGLGVSQSTAATDAAATDQNRSDGPPPMVTSLDGRSRPATRDPTLSATQRQQAGEFLDRYIAADPALQLATWHKNFLAEITRAGRLTLWPAEDIVAKADARARAMYEGVIADLVRQHAQVSTPTPGDATVTHLRRSR